jgi:predicted glutamine amidotransferase
MCRMLAFTGYESMGDLLQRFQKLAVDGKSTDGRGHRDGWGIGWFNPGCYLIKKGECAVTSRTYADTVTRVNRESPQVVLAHLRKASPGTPVTDEEAHPFQKDNLLFCHNGSIYQVGGKPLGEELDSILFFKKIQETSLKEAISYFRALKYTSLTCILTDSNTIWAYRDCTEKEDYYTLYYLKTKEYVLFCSEPIIPGAWTLLGNGELVTASTSLDITAELLTP